MKPLEKGDTVGIVSPATAPDPDIYEFTRAFFHNLGFAVRMFGEYDRPFGRMSAGDAVRAAHITAAFEDPNISAIFCTRGGYGSGRLLDALRTSAVADNPKIFIGYSDITNLLMHLNRKCGLVTFHGPMLWDFYAKNEEWSISNCFEVLTGVRDRYQFEQNQFSALQNGVATGRLVGGNISILESLAGTESLRVPDGAILVLEDVGEFLYAVDRSFVHLRRGGVFEKASGVIISDLKLKDSEDTENSLGLSLREMLSYHFSDFDGPVAYHLPCGHTQRQMTLPIGAMTSLSVSDTVLEIGFEDFWSARNASTVAA